MHSLTCRARIFIQTRYMYHHQKVRNIASWMTTATRLQMIQPSIVMSALSWQLFTPAPFQSNFLCFYGETLQGNLHQELSYDIFFFLLLPFRPVKSKIRTVQSPNQPFPQELLLKKTMVHILLMNYLMLKNPSHSILMCFHIITGNA